MAKRELTGFTLIELMLVMSIIALLATIAFPSYNTVRAKTRDIKRLIDITNIRSALEQFNQDFNTYNPGTLDDPCGKKQQPVSVCAEKGNKGLLEYLPDVANLKDPLAPTIICHSKVSTACQYSFAEDAGANNYKVYFYLETENRQVGLKEGLNFVSEKGFNKE